MSSTKRRKLTHDPSKSTSQSTFHPQSHIHPARRARVAQSLNTSSQNGDASAETKAKLSTSARPTTRDRSSTSSKIHSLRRQLQNPNTRLPPDLRVAKELELAGLLTDQRKNMEERERKKQIKKYHFVRFMERKKAEKSLRRLLAKVGEGAEAEGSESSTDSTEELAAKIEEAKVDLAYTIYAPLADKYVGIFVEASQDGAGANGHSAGDDSGTSGEDNPGERRPGRTKNAMWQTVKSLMGDETALEKLRHRSSGDVNGNQIEGVRKRTRNPLRTTTDPKKTRPQSQAYTSRKKAVDLTDRRNGNAVEKKRSKALDGLIPEPRTQVIDSHGNDDEADEDDFFE